jgi:hypothetical protein
LGRSFQSDGLRLGSVGSSSSDTGYMIIVGNYDERDLMIRNWWLVGRMGHGHGACSLFGDWTVVHMAGVVRAMCDDHRVANKGDLWGCFSSKGAGWHCSVLYIGAALVGRLSTQH